MRNIEKGLRQFTDKEKLDQIVLLANEHRRSIIGEKALIKKLYKICEVK